MEMLKENKTFCFLASQSRDDWLTNKLTIPLKLCWVKCLGAVSAQARVRCLRQRFNTRRQETSGYFKWRRAVFVGTEPGSFPDPNTGRFSAWTELEHRCRSTKLSYLWFAETFTGSFYSADLVCSSTRVYIQRDVSCKLKKSHLLYSFLFHSAKECVSC